MAQYGYSTPYSGQQVAPLPPGYMEAATAPGRNLAMGITAIGQGLGKALERYTENKKGHEALDETNTAVTKMYLQQMESDPKVQAVRYFEDTGQLPTGVDETTLKSYEAQMKRDAGMISNLVGNSNKWADMSLTKKQAALGQTVTMLNQYRTNQQDDLKNEATRQALAAGALQLSEAQREEAAAPFFTQALIDLYARPPGQGPTAPYADVTQEVMDKYGGKLTQKQVQALIPLTRRMGQTLPAGIVPTGATVGPEGTKVEYGLPATPTAIPVAGAPGYFQTMVGGKAVGDIKQIYPQVQAKINELPEQQQKWANEKQTELSKDKSLMVLNEQVKAVEEMRSIPKNPSGDIALIIKYMKTLDPGSIVSPTELRTIGNAGSLPTQIQNWYNSYATGDKLTPEVRVQIMEAAESVLRGGIKAIQPTIEDAISAGKYRGVPEEAILPLNTIKRWREVSQQSQAQDLQRFQSPADMKAAGVTRGLVFNPANGKYSEYIQD